MKNHPQQRTEVGFTAGQAARLARVPYYSLDYWAKSGVVVPSIRTAHGTGSRRLYSIRDIIALSVAAELRDEGITLQASRKIVVALLGISGLVSQPLPGTRFLVSGGNVLPVRSDEHLVSLLNEQPKQGVLRLVLDLDHVVGETRQAATRMSLAA